MKFTLTIPKSQLDAAYQQAIAAAVSSARVKGFRPGKAPANLVVPNLDQTQLYETALNRVFPPIYHDYISKNHLEPITSPRVTLKSAPTDNDWQVEVEIAQKPKVTLGAYKPAVKKVNQKYAPLVKPKQTKKSTTPAVTKATSSTASDWVNAIFDTLITQVTVKVPGLLIERSLEHQLQHLSERLETLAVDLDTYLKSQDQTLEGLKASYTKRTDYDLRVDFILEAIAAKEGLEPTEADLKKVLDEIADEPTRQAIMTSRASLVSLYTTLQRNRVLQYLKTL